MGDANQLYIVGLCRLDGVQTGFWSETKINSFDVVWNAGSKTEGTGTLMGENGVQKTSKAGCQVGSTETKCGIYNWKTAQLGSQGEFVPRLMSSGCPSRDESGDDIEFPALLDINEWNDISRDAFSCNQF